MRRSLARDLELHPLDYSQSLVPLLGDCLRGLSECGKYEHEQDDIHSQHRKHCTADCAHPVADRPKEASPDDCRRSERQSVTSVKSWISQELKRARKDVSWLKVGYSGSYIN